MARSFVRPAGAVGRRRLLAGAAGMAAAALAGPPPLLARDVAATPAFDIELVKQRARALAAKRFDDGRERLPHDLKALSYDQYREIRFRPERALWRGDGLFQVQFFHRGYIFDRPVRINLLDEGGPRPVASPAGLFDVGGNRFDPPPPDGLGFAGFRLHHPLHRPDYFDEFAVFLGASYFRLLGREQHFGLSARGLAIDTALPRGEEFPFFREFWLRRPPPDATAMTLYALLDSESATGAYRFVLRPGSTTEVDVSVSIYPRRDIAKLGIAPLTSMFMFGENHGRRFADYRPEVHDSDGLLMHAGHGEWIWRPLRNPRAVRVSAFLDRNPRGFGLMQRDRDFASYQDLEMNYQRRPSLWVEPAGDWGAGRVELVEIPSDSEVNDNIVAYWVPAAPALAGRPVEVGYRLHASGTVGAMPPRGRTVATRWGLARHAGHPNPAPAGLRRFSIDFAGGDLPLLRPAQPVHAVVSASAGEIRNTRAYRNAAIGGWRALFDFLPDGDRSADLRCFLRLRDDVLTETWSYLWTA